jgi:hypothetical protein
VAAACAHYHDAALGTVRHGDHGEGAVRLGHAHEAGEKLRVASSI